MTFGRASSLRSSFALLECSDLSELSFIYAFINNALPSLLGRYKQQKAERVNPYGLLLF